MESYKAVIVDPNKPPVKPDNYDTLTIPGEVSNYAISPVPLREWAKKVLPSASKGAYCVIYRTERVEVERITQEDTKNAATGA